MTNITQQVEKLNDMIAAAGIEATRAKETERGLAIDWNGDLEYFEDYESAEKEIKAAQ